MGLNNKIRYGLDAALASITGLPEIVNENLNSFPQNPTDHIETRFVPTNRRATTVGEGPYTKKLGYYRATIRTLLNSGTGIGLDYADLVEDFFTPGIWLEVGKDVTSLDLDFMNQVYSTEPATITVVVDYSEAAGSYEESPYYCTPVVIGWHCDTP